MGTRITPSSTYRLQLHRGFDFDAASAVAPYLAALGVSHAYSSPYLQAELGSSHGYDVVDHARVNSELGGSEAHARLSRSLRENQLGQVLDIVPNHMSIASQENRWWWDLLRHGHRSDYAKYFDIDWHPPEARLQGKILMPVLGDHYGRVLEAGDLKLERVPDGLAVRYYEHLLPIDPASLDGADPDQVLETTGADREQLHRLLERQHYRLASWRTAGQNLDYRRFFDINSLAGIRIEDEKVFLETHALILRWLAVGVLDGVRVDHLDGLRDPRRYLERLHEAAPESWIVVEKILAADEALPSDWPVAGTTGYEFLNRLSRVYVDPAGEEPLTLLYSEFTGVEEDFAEIAYRDRKRVLDELLATDLHRLAAGFERVCEADRNYRDFTRHDLEQVLAEFIACLPVYRTYLRPGEPVSDADRRDVLAAAAEAKRRRPELDPELVGFLVAVLLDKHAGRYEEEFVARLQQTTGAVMAKGVEDTAFYRYHRLVALNEVGGDPGRFSLGLDEFHDAACRTADEWPATMLATSTHDTKRSEDVRARLALLAEIPGRWRESVERWAAHNERHRRDGVPDRNTEYLVYQTLVGAYPIELDRLLVYLEKAAREAKTHTSWTAANEQYESALRGFATSLLDDRDFTADLSAFAGELVWPGRVNSLAWKLIAMTSAGVPDLYQGSELWDLTLVDPDNRRPVDFDLRRRLLAELEQLSAADTLRRADEGLPKLLVVQRALRLRRRRAAAFEPGASYRPLPVSGPAAEHLVAFARAESVVTLAPRLVLKLAGKWGDTSVELPAGAWVNELTGESAAGGRRPVSELLGSFPVALLRKA
jgi:(1->4)-alpha-D-glucan 1-alpha-D-glucosylmutase